MAKAARVKLVDQSRAVSWRNWRDTLAAATDIALIGFCVFVASLPVVTIGAAVATGSFAVRHWVLHGSNPRVAEMWRLFLRWIIPGVLGCVLLTVAGALLFFDLRSVSAGLVPGGQVVLVVTAAVVAWLAGVTVLTVVHLGRWPADGWRTAIRWAAAVVVLSPHRAVVLLGVCAMAGALALMVPATLPLALGCGLFALHVVADRLLPDAAESATGDERVG